MDSSVGGAAPTDGGSHADVLTIDQGGMDHGEAGEGGEEYVNVEPEVRGEAEGAYEPAPNAEPTQDAGADGVDDIDEMMGELGVDPTSTLDPDNVRAS